MRDNIPVSFAFVSKTFGSFPSFKIPDNHLQKEPPNHMKNKDGKLIQKFSPRKLETIARFFQFSDQTKGTASHLLAHLILIKIKARETLAYTPNTAPLWTTRRYLLFCPCPCGGEHFSCAQRYTHLYLKRGPLVDRCT